MSDELQRQAALNSAVDQLRVAVPQASAIQISSPQRGSLVVSFKLGESSHGFRLHREAGLWCVREWVVNGRTQRLRGEHRRPGFSTLVSELLGALRRPPRIRVADLRCPKKHRQLFAKIIIQNPSQDSPSNLIEVSCPWCKRESGQLTFHYYDFSGRLVKSETTEPYIRQEPDPHWYKDPDTVDVRPTSPANTSTTNTQEVLSGG